MQTLKSCGHALDTSSEAFGYLRATDAALAIDGETLRTRLEEDGYLYIPGVLGRENVQAARRSVLERAAAEGILDPAFPVEDGILKESVNPYFRPIYTQDNAPLLSVLYGDDGPMMRLFAALIGGPVRHFDYTWLRAVGPGPGTQPHCDIVYMGRGTHELYTAWTPLGDLPLTVGGLMVLEGSHHRSPVVLSEYLKQDVDTYCSNGPNVEKVLSGKLNWEHWDGSLGPWNGAITSNPAALREQLGGRWLTANYQLGDVLIFTMRTVHASIDNSTRTLRLSTDTRYQHADAPVDERWIDGEDGTPPIAHGVAGKRGKIC